MTTSSPQEIPVTYTTTRVAVLVGSVRADSVNRRLAESLRDLAPEGVTLDIIDDLGALPFYDASIDDDSVSVATELRARVAQADRVLAVTPEHNGTMPAVLSNGIDWLSRPYGAGAMVGKPFGVLGVTPTPYGGRWSHEVAHRAAGIAGARVVEDVLVSQTSIDIDVFSDPAVLERFRTALAVLVAAEPATAAA
jgi:NAD(P)H-dependent FMN reductase